MMEMMSVFFSQPMAMMAIFYVASLYQTGNIEDDDEEEPDNEEDGDMFDKSMEDGKKSD